MNPGRELDALIAEKVMGLEPWPEQRFNERAFKAPIVPFGQEPKPCSCPNYSTDIAAAWQVVGRLDGQWTLDGHEGIGWTAKFYSSTGGLDAVVVRVESRAPTAPHAICLAALKAVGAL